LSVPSLTAEQLDELPYGAIELDASGKILEFNRAEEELSDHHAQDVIGRNFFTEIAPCSDVRQFKGRFTEFLNSNRPTEVFSFTYQFPDRPVQVELVFVRVNQSLAFVLSKKGSSP